MQKSNNLLIFKNVINFDSYLLQFVPRCDCEEVILVLLVAESMAVRHAVLSQSPEFKDIRQSAGLDATTVYDLLTIATVRWGQVALLQEVITVFFLVLYCWNKVQYWFCSVFGKINEVLLRRSAFVEAARFGIAVHRKLSTFIGGAARGYTDGIDQFQQLSFSCQIVLWTSEPARRRFVGCFGFIWVNLFLARIDKFIWNISLCKFCVVVSMTDFDQSFQVVKW